MRVELRMPVESFEPATVLAIHHGLGEPVRKGEPVVEMITRDRIFDITSPSTGQIVEILVGAGEQVRAGDTLLVIENGKV